MASAPLGTDALAEPAERMKRITTTSPTSSEDATRMAKAIRWIGGSTIVACISMLSLAAVTDPAGAPRFVALIFATVLPIIAWLRLVTQGQVRLAGLGLITQYWIVITAATLTAEPAGITEISAVYYVAFVLVTGMLMGSRWGIGAAVLAALTELGLLVAEWQGLLAPSGGRPLEVFLLHVNLFIIVLAIQHLALNTLRGALLEAKREIASRLQAEAALRDHREHLEELVAERTAHLEREIEARKASERSMRKLSTAVESSSSPICITDREGTIEYVNPAFCANTGYRREEAVGSNTRILESGRHDPELYERMWATISAGEVWRGELQNRTKAGEIVWDRTSISPIHDEEGTITHFVAVKEDITALKHVELEMYELAHFDRLTGLPNRRLFFDRLTQVLSSSERHERPFSLMFIDLDGFKAVNDSYGHDIGDALLREASKRLQACVRSSDTVARMGGDEFTVLLPELDPDLDAAGVARRMLDTLAQPFELEGNTCHIGACIGISRFPDHGPDQESLLSAADAAMYAVKQNGKNDYRIAA